MVMIDCPWCEAPVALDEAEEPIRCDACSIIVEWAPDAADGRELPAAA